MATTQEAVQISAIGPTLTVDDLQKSIREPETILEEPCNREVTISERVREHRVRGGNRLT